jgi:hypothetical protein
VGSPIAIGGGEGGGGGGGGGRGGGGGGGFHPRVGVRGGSLQKRARCPERRQLRQRTGSWHCNARWSRARQLKQRPIVAAMNACREVVGQLEGALRRRSCRPSCRGGEERQVVRLRRFAGVQPGSSSGDPAGSAVC